jgi:hypothetical protein
LIYTLLAYHIWSPPRGAEFQIFFIHSFRIYFAYITDLSAYFCSIFAHVTAYFAYISFHHVYCYRILRPHILPTSRSFFTYFTAYFAFIITCFAFSAIYFVFVASPLQEPSPIILHHLRDFPTIFCDPARPSHDIWRLCAIIFGFSHDNFRLFRDNLRLPATFQCFRDLFTLLTSINSHFP